ncbi:tryptophan--tRNA ligase [beta proteobacterium AAP99]|nr:tryptophan--tRNA ligase [beta proteobacterium AAP99]
MKARVVSGMRPTGQLHLGHYHGAIKNWVRMQNELDCLFFVADWHALTTHYENPQVLAESTWDLIIDWLAAGVDPDKATIFIQSRVPEHAELHLLLSMVTPLAWLERVPTYKDQIEKLKDKDLTTYGFLGYPLLQAADVLVYRATQVPVGEDQAPHIEMMREIARRFNYFYGREPGFEEKVAAAIKKLSGKDGKRFVELRSQFQTTGSATAREEALALIAAAGSLGAQDRERLKGHLDGTGRSILTEPATVLTETPKLPGLDGGKMSKSYGNTIMLREQPADVAAKVKKMPTDPARVRRTDAGNPENCPVWQFHKIYSDAATREWVVKGCTTAGIGCLECKQPVIDGIVREITPMHERAMQYIAKPQLVREIAETGSARARAVATETMREVREVMGIAAA